MRDLSGEPILTDLGLGRTSSAPHTPTHGHRSTLRAPCVTCDLRFENANYVVGRTHLFS
jgi:hypothetical protein